MATYFGGLRDNTELATGLPVDALHAHLVREPGQAEKITAALGAEKIISAGVIEGRNVWKNDHAATLDVLEKLDEQLGSDRLWVAPSCSLLHVLINLEIETELPSEVADWLSFGRRKLDEIATFTQALNEGREAVRGKLERNQAAIEARRQSVHVRRLDVQDRVNYIQPGDARRNSPFQQRQPLQHKAWNQPLLPTTTIGSFPQTPEIRKHRAQHRKGEISEQQYTEFNEMMDVIADMDADVISIEASRSQMELLDAFAEHGYPNEVGPGVYDIHSPRIPSTEEMAENLRRALAYLEPMQLWVNPDCGLKTRKWEEVEPALTRMVEAAKTVRGKISSTTQVRR